LRPLYKALFSALQRGKGLEGFSSLDGHSRLSRDGTGDCSSPTRHGDPCGEKPHRNGTLTYYHPMLGAVLVHPDHKAVFPLAPEPILKQEGAKKNDCERNAAQRLLEDVRREHPPLKRIVIEDARASKAPHIRPLNALNLRFILGAQPTDHKFLFEWVDHTPTPAEYTVTDADGTQHRFRDLNGVPLNDAHFDREVNFLEYWETQPNGKVTHFSWVTDFPIDETHLMTLMRGARARWKIENETFNTLKNPGDHFEHNFGHGHQNLSTVLRHRMMRAFLIDPIPPHCGRRFQTAVTAAQGKSRFGRLLRARFDLCQIPDWETLYRSIIRPPPMPRVCDTS